MGRLTIIERAAKYVAAMPAALSGSGGHNATFAVACALIKGFDLSVGQARPLLFEYNQRCSPAWKEKDLEHKLNQADKTADDQPRGYLIGNGDHEVGSSETRLTGKGNQPVKALPKPEYDEAALKSFAGSWRDRVDLIWLANRSVYDPSLVPTDDYLSMLYGPKEKVLLFSVYKSQGQAVWPDEVAPKTGREGVWYLAQPVDGLYHPNPRQGKTSRRSEESVTDWRFLVLESDSAPVREWLGAIVQLPLRICALYTSGGRSVHALVKVNARTKMDWDEKKEKMKPGFHFLIRNGADPGVLSAVRLTRLPGCWREGTMKEDAAGKEYYHRYERPRLQKLLYVNPDPEVRPLCEILPRRNVVNEWMGRADQANAGDQMLKHGLRYYAPVSAALRDRLKSMRGGAA